MAPDIHIHGSFAICFQSIFFLPPFSWVDEYVLVCQHALGDCGLSSYKEIELRVASFVDGKEKIKEKDRRDFKIRAFYPFVIAKTCFRTLKIIVPPSTISSMIWRLLTYGKDKKSSVF